MTKQTTYAQKLRDPRWQKKRLEIMERDEFTCQICGCKDKTLNVHHRHYSRGREPWEYDGNALVTLCEPCHDLVHDFNELLAAWIEEISLSNLTTMFFEVTGSRQRAAALHELFIRRDVEKTWNEAVEQISRGSK